jgi:hypothetical protein
VTRPRRVCSTPPGVFCRWMTPASAAGVYFVLSGCLSAIYHVFCGVGCQAGDARWPLSNSDNLDNVSRLSCQNGSESILFAFFPILVQHLRVSRVFRCTMMDFVGLRVAFVFGLRYTRNHKNQLRGAVRASECFERVSC